MAAHETAAGSGAIPAPPGYVPWGQPSPFVDLIGPLYERRDADGQTFGMRVEKRHTNRGGICHGGVLLSLADSVLGYELLDAARGITRIATASLSAEFFGSAAVGDWIEARVAADRIGGRLAFMQVTLAIGERRIARVGGVVALTRAPAAGWPPTE